MGHCRESAGGMQSPLMVLNTFFPARTGAPCMCYQSHYGDL